MGKSQWGTNRPGPSFTAINPKQTIGKREKRHNWLKLGRNYAWKLVLRCTFLSRHQSGSLHQLSSTTTPSLLLPLKRTDAAEAVRTTRFTLLAFAADWRRFIVPFNAGSMNCAWHMIKNRRLHNSHRKNELPGIWPDASWHSDFKGTQQINPISTELVIRISRTCGKVRYIFQKYSKIIRRNESFHRRRNQTNEQSTRQCSPGDQSSRPSLRILKKGFLEFTIDRASMIGQNWPTFLRKLNVVKTAQNGLNLDSLGSEQLMIFPSGRYQQAHRPH